MPRSAFRALAWSTPGVALLVSVMFCAGVWAAVAYYAVAQARIAYEYFDTWKVSAVSEGMAHPPAPDASAT